MNLFLQSDQSSFSDIFKDKFISQFTENQLDIGSAVAAVLFALVMGLVIFAVYKICYRGAVYSFSFNVSLVMMAVITCVIILTISSNVVLSLGMVGALSIVRFRTAIKDPVDIMFLFWAITVGIVVGAHQFTFALISTVLIALLCFVSLIFRSKEGAYLLIIKYVPGAGPKIDKIIESVHGNVKNKTIRKGVAEVIIEISGRNVQRNLVEGISSISGVDSVVLVNYNGDYAE